MAFKQDTFWEDHPSVGPESPYQPGLRLYEVVNSGHFYRFIAAMALFILFMALLELRAAQWMDILARLAAILFWPLILTLPALDGAFRRYRLYDDSSATPEFEGKPEKLYVLLRRVANSPRLLNRLTAPEVVSSSPPIFRNTFPEFVAFLPLYLMYGAMVALTALLLVALTPPYSTIDLLALALAPASFGAPLLVVWWMYCRVRTGIRMLGLGGSQTDDRATTAQFDDARDAELRWDLLLGKPYLLLEVNGRRIRYYSPVNEPLHLLRLAKHRMPHLTLRA